MSEMRFGTITGTGTTLVDDLDPATNISIDVWAVDIQPTANDRVIYQVVANRVVVIANMTNPAGIIHANAVGNVTAMAGGTITSGALYRRAGTVTGQINMTYGSTITVPANGDIANTVIATINNALYQPITPAPFTGHAGGPMANGYIDTDGTCVLTAVAPGSVINAGVARGIVFTFVAA